MANKLRGESVLIRDGKPDIIVIFDFNAICEIEAQTGYDLDEMIKVMGNARKASSPSFLRALFYGCIKSSTDLSLEDAGTIIGEEGPQNVFSAVTAAVAAATASTNPPASATVGNAPAPAVKKKTPSRGRGTKQ